MRSILLLLLVSCAGAQSQYDLLLKGGHVIDAKNGISAIRDVAIAQGKIAAVEQNIAGRRRRGKTIDVSSLYVTPGLVDMHVHVFAGSMGREYIGENCVRPDGFTFRSGVTTVVDAGSSGWRNFGEFRDQIINRSKTRVFAMLNIVGSGMGGRPDVEQNTSDMEPERTAEVAKRHKDVVVGIKVAHYAGPEWIAVDRGVEAGKLAGVPVMVDFATFRPERPFQELVLKHLRPGDIYTHTYLSAVPMLDESGQTAALSVRGEEARHHLRRGPRRRQLFVSAGDSSHPAGLHARFHLHRSARGQHECGHEGHAQRAFEIPQYGHVAG